MLTITVGEAELFDEETQTFFTSGGTSYDFEHSLVSLSKWESKYERPFLSKQDMLPDEIADYVVMMAISPGVTLETLNHFSEENFQAVNDYIQSTQTATKVNDDSKRKSRGEVITAELIYYWLIAFNIPMACENWHLNRLFALIQVCNAKSEKPKKMSNREISERNAKLNAERRAALGSSG